MLWSLWSRNREDHVTGSLFASNRAEYLRSVGSHAGQTAYDGPLKFRRSADIPSIVVLHYDDLPAYEVEEREGYRLTRPIRTIVDVSNQREVSSEILSKAFTEATVRRLVTGQDIDVVKRVQQSARIELADFFTFAFRLFRRRMILGLTGFCIWPYCQLCRKL